MAPTWYMTDDRMTPCGNKAKPTWQQTVDMVDTATKTVSASHIRASFLHCGFNLSATTNFDVYVMKMNHKLRNIERQIHLYSYPYVHLLNPVDFVQPYSETRLTVEEYAILQQSQYTDSIDSVVSQEWLETVEVIDGQRQFTDTVLETINFIVDTYRVD